MKAIKIGCLPGTDTGAFLPAGFTEQKIKDRLEPLQCSGSSLSLR